MEVRVGSKAGRSRVLVVVVDDEKMSILFWFMKQASELLETPAPCCDPLVPFVALQNEAQIWGYRSMVCDVEF